jgi:transglutaminase-like putative cysteine protease
MFRTAGLAARYVHGTCKFSSGSTYGHVWAQVLVDGKWYVADATSSKNSLGSVSNWNTNSFTLNKIYASLPF